VDKKLDCCNNRISTHQHNYLMLKLHGNLALERCPHCSVANPHLNAQHNFQSNNHSKNWLRMWVVYVCATCGGAVTAWSDRQDATAGGYYPSAVGIDQEIPDRPRVYLQQAHDSLHAPAGAVMLAASAVDSMLKAKGYQDGSLYARIEQAVAKNLITPDMGKWAHAVRLDANDQRHADDAADLPTEADAQRVLDFARTLAEVMFVLPSRVERGLKDKPPAA
jgi:DNA-directed RNA polymerase subunit RPC12/RpoP